MRHLKNHSKNMHDTVYTQCSNAIPETFQNNCSEILNTLLMQGKACLNLNSIKTDSCTNDKHDL